MALYNKYECKTLDDIVGQDTSISILKHDIETNKFPNCYCFAGKYGCGKSNTAKIFAKTINAYTYTIDSSMFNKAENVEEIINLTMTKPIGYEKLVIILEEAHNIFMRKDSLGGQKLLLTLENTPSYVIYILTTTEYDKLIDTIKSRVKTLVFNSIGTVDITNRLKYICNCEGTMYDSLALKEIARRSDGSMRKAISNLEKVIGEKHITMSTVTNMLCGKYDDMFNILDGIMTKNIKDVVTTLNRVTNIEIFTRNFFSFVLGICVYGKTKDIALSGIPDVLENDIKGYVNIAEKIMNDFYELQTNASNDVLKELFIATTYKEMFCE